MERLALRRSSIDSAAAPNGDCESLRVEIEALKAEQEAQGRQIDLLIRFVENAISKEAELRAENAAYRILIDLQRRPGTSKSDQP
jgi:hypothetical protein